MRDAWRGIRWIIVVGVALLGLALYSKLHHTAPTAPSVTTSTAASVITGPQTFLQYERSHRVHLSPAQVAADQAACERYNATAGETLHKRFGIPLERC